MNGPFPSPANLQLTSSDNDGGDVDNDGGNVDSAALSYGRAAIQQLEQVKRAPFFCKLSSSIFVACLAGARVLQRTLRVF